MPMTDQAREHIVTQRYTIRVGDGEQFVRATAVWPIPEVLDLEIHFEPGSDAAARGGESLVADLLDSRMIAPPRPRRRRERAVSSRAVFYAGTDA